MSEEEKKNTEQGDMQAEEKPTEDIDQEKLAEEWAKMAEGDRKQEEETSEEVDQEKLAEEWAKMAQQSETEGETTEEVDQEKLAEQWAAMAGGEKEQEESPPETELIEKEKLDILMDIPLEISVEIGSTTMPLEEVLKLNPNSIVELDRYINQPVDIKVNGKLIARGELYTVDDNFGIKITSIVTVQERMKLLTDNGI